MGWFEVDKEGLRQVHERLVARRGEEARAYVTEN